LSVVQGNLGCGQQGATEMTKIARLSFTVLLTITAVPLANAQNCYSTGQGPIMSCFEGNRKVTVRKAFKHKDGQSYAWDHKLNSYCYRNEYGNPHCMQIGQVTALQCSEDKGQIFCE
jgi:hypothetical protein